MHHTDIEANYRELQYQNSRLLADGKQPRTTASVSQFSKPPASLTQLLRLSDEIIELQRPIAIRHQVSFGDFIQFAGAAGITNCPGAPSLEFMAGRFNFSFASPDGLVPEPADPVNKIIARFADAGFSPNEIVDLLVSHTVAAQDHVDPTIPVGIRNPLCLSRGRV